LAGLSNSISNIEEYQIGKIVNLLQRQGMRNRVGKRIINVRVKEREKKRKG